MIDMNELEILYFANDLPVPYTLTNENNKGLILEIKPIKVLDWGVFEACLSVINQERRDRDDFEILSMSYLDFVKNVLIPESVDPKTKQSINAMRLANLFHYSLGIDEVNIGSYKGKTTLILNPDTEPIVITSKEFDEIRKIILFQNIEDYDDRYISPDVKELYAQYMETVNTNSVNPTLERKKSFVISKTGIMMNEINKMSYRLFNQIYSNAVETDMYIARKMIQSSQKYDVKEDVPYPLFEKKKDKYDCIFVNKETVTNKIGKVNQ